ncbi:hypothetical protein M514_04748 [Trichuris suis]|uniref:SWIM-type domain-containing protein n=1 Tax=Trichuris suis TaxID=68888 RepID=A0A085MWT2_9BILA|nr:hypothetical protein M513_04748 [Trichuris suis]KFD61678.1 hypothetical protein M514_04748 [Trichuris suis]KHJ42270.1 SWIM zinc finger domain protein [Trichuris suis]
MDFEEQMTWEDSERFEEDSLSSFVSELGSSSANSFRGWEEPGGSAYNVENLAATSKSVLSLADISARTVAKFIPFEMVERFKQPVPEVLQQRIAFFSFPEKVADIRLYCCLSNGSPDEYIKGRALYAGKAVLEIIQIGFHLSAVVQVVPGVFGPRLSNSPTLTKGFAAVGFDKSRYHVAITLDRQKIISCACTCGQTWCQHCVAACLYRIKEADRVPMRAPVSESLSQLDRSQLQKFAQNLVAQLPRDVIPVAQKLLDELLNQKAKINSECGAPDPTAGAAIGDLHAWSLQDRTLKDIVQKLLIKYCTPSPLVYSDVNFLSNYSPPTATEFDVLLRPFRGREPEGLWNLLGIVREMMRRRDNNASRLLSIVTSVCVQNSQVVQWWYFSKMSLVLSVNSGSSPHDAFHTVNLSLRAAVAKQKANPGGHQLAAKYSCSLLMDEIVHLWRLAALNPVLSLEERRSLAYQLSQFQACTENTLQQSMSRGFEDVQGDVQQSSNGGADFFPNNSTSLCLSKFRGFKEAYEMCLLDWINLDTESFRFAGSKSSCILLKQFNGIVKDTTGGGSSHLRGERPKASNLACNVSRSMDIRQRISWNGALDNQGPLYPTSASSKGQEGQVGVGGTSEFDDESLYTDLSRSASYPEVTEEELTEEEAKSLSYDGADGHGEGERTNAAEELGVVNEAAVQATLDRKDWTVPNSSLANLPAPSDLKTICFAVCEALHAHGNLSFARKLAVEIAEYMVDAQENLCFDVPSAIRGLREALPQNRLSGGRKKKQAFDPHQPNDAQVLESTESVCEALSSACFLLDVLVENNSHDSVAFCLGLLMLSLQRSAAPSRFLETKVFFLESEILNKMKTMSQSLTNEEVEAVRECAIELVSATKHRRWKGAMPMSLAVYLAHVLLLKKNSFRPFSDEQLGFEIALAALAMKTEIPEDKHPLMYECVRRHRGELSVELFVRFKDDWEKLAKIMDILLDIEMHQMHNTPRRTNVSQVGRAMGGFASPSRSSGENASSASSSSEANVETLTEGHFASCSLSSGHGHLPEQSSHGTVDATYDMERYESASQAYEALAQEIFADGDGFSPEMVDASSSGPCAVMSSAVTWPNLACSIRNRKAACLCATDRLTVVNCKPNPRKVVAQQVEEDNCCKPFQITNASILSKFRMDACLPSESHVHFMMELAKRLSTEAGGNHATAIFTAPGSISNQVHVSHRALHLCSFQVGLYALGLHNKLSNNWQSRTYSSFVSWISSQAMDIGRSALNILMDTWEKHLTPSEVATLADNASQSRDPAVVEAAAQLALSVLSHAQFLNSSEIQRAVSQCKEQNTGMLESACLAVERAGQNFGVCPDVLFQISLQWYEVYKEAVSRGSNADQPSGSNVSADSAEARSRPAWLDHNYVRQLMNVQGMLQLPLVMESANHEPPCWNTTMQPVPYRGVLQQYFADPRINMLGQPMFSFSGPVSMSIGVNAFNGQAQAQAAPVAPANSVAPAACCSYGGQAPVPQAPFWRPAESMYGSEFPMPVNVATCMPLIFSHSNYNFRRSYDRVNPSTTTTTYPYGITTPHTNEVNINLESVSSEDHANAACYLQNAYRVGILAMETMGRRISDERSYTKFCENPPYGDDVKLLLVFAKRLGFMWVIRFAAVAARSVLSPFVLWELFIDVVDFIGRSSRGNSPSGVASNLQMNLSTLISKAMSHSSVQALLEKCHEMFHKAALQKLSHPRFVQSDADDLVTLVRAAQVAFSIGNNGQARFNDFMQSLKRQKACKKELWIQLVNAVNFK